MSNTVASAVAAAFAIAALAIALASHARVRALETRVDAVADCEGAP